MASNSISVSLNPLNIRRDQFVLILKWMASIIQIAGYATTAFGLTPLNIYLFLAGLIGWFIVGIFWNDRAIMLIHLIALGSMIIGMNS
ncbi:DUF6552 family protein [Curvivirga sp.]|uniref:DUF6552 family protein n=1 Tax=Curvivirga sp. TaxID=2856848 RepID=UPI003B5B6B08